MTCRRTLLGRTPHECHDPIGHEHYYHSEEAPVDDPRKLSLDKCRAPLHHIEQRRLARTIGTNETEDFVWMQFEIHVVQCIDSAKLFREVRSDKHTHHV